MAIVIILVRLVNDLNMYAKVTRCSKITRVFEQSVIRYVNKPR